MKLSHTIETPMHSAGAIGMIRVVHPNPGELGLKDPQRGKLVLGDLLGIDQGVITRWDDDSIMLMPHGGVAILRAISSALTTLGVPALESPDPVSIYPEAKNEIEAWMLYTLSKASSPLAVDVLLEQPAKWRAVGVECLEQALAYTELTAERFLNRLISPPIVAAIGRANIGKSTLINALAKEQVAIVADVAGTTRDHVGVMIDLGGLVVRWIDTPGIDERIDQSDEIKVACSALSRVDLIIHCIDSIDDPGELDHRLQTAIQNDVPVLRLGMRGDLGKHSCPIDLILSSSQKRANTNRLTGIEELVERICSMLVPTQVLSEAKPWRFWDAISADSSIDSAPDRR